MKFMNSVSVVKFFILVLFLLLPALAHAQADGAVGRQYFINPAGSDANDGLSAEKPFKTIQHGLDVAQPGTVLNLARGVYRETLTTKINGTENAPIIVRGTDNAKKGDNGTILFGTGRILNVDHSYYQFEGFAIIGQEALSGKTLPVNPNEVIKFKEANQALIKDGRLIYIGSADTAKNITGVKIVNMRLRGAGGECVRIRNAAHHNEISNSVIDYCGMHGKENGTAFTFHNGEGVYIGTSPKSTNQPMHENDTSSYNTVANNIIYTYGSECFNVKENAHHNSFTNNECRYNLEPLEYSGSNVELRGDHNIVEGNTISDSLGWNLKLKSDASKYDKGGNIIRNNTFAHSAGPNIQNEAASVTFCGNKIDNKVKGATEGTVTKNCKE